MRRKLSGIVLRVAIFTVVCLVFTFSLIAVFGQLRFEDRAGYEAVFTNISGLKSGNFVRIAGVEVGKVGDLTLHRDGTVTVGFAVDKGVRLTEGTKAVVRYENLIGDRYLALEEGPGSPRRLAPGATIPLARTSPALDIDALIGGFRPLFRALDPDQVNALSGQLLRIFQGQGGTLASVLAQTSTLTSTLAGRSELIGELITNLNTVLHTFATRDHEFSDGLDKLSQLVEGLAQRKDDISTGMAYINAAAASVSRSACPGTPADQGRGARDRPDVGAGARRPRVCRQAAQGPARRLSGIGPAGPQWRLLRLLLLRRADEDQRQRWQPGFHQAVVPAQRAVHAEMKRFQIKPVGQRSPILVGLIGTVIVACVVLAAFEYNKLPFIKNTNDYSAYFSEAGGIKVGSTVRISGMGVGRVSDVRLDGTRGPGRFHRSQGHRAGGSNGSGDQDRDDSGRQDA